MMPLASYGLYHFTAKLTNKGVIRAGIIVIILVIMISPSFQKSPVSSDIVRENIQFILGPSNIYTNEWWNSYNVTSDGCGQPYPSLIDFCKEMSQKLDKKP